MQQTVFYCLKKGLLFIDQAAFMPKYIMWYKTKKRYVQNDTLVIVMHRGMIN